MQTTFKVLALSAAVSLLSALPAQAQTRVTFKSAKTGSSYYQMGVQIAEAMKAGTKGEIIVTLEESQGSTQNVMEVQGARRRLRVHHARRRWSNRRRAARARSRTRPIRSSTRSARCSRSRR